MDNQLNLSTLSKTWIFDLDGTLVKHNGYKLDGMDTLLEGVILTSRTEEYREATIAFLRRYSVRYDEILFNMPMGERIVVNDRKPSGLDMAVAMNIDRNLFQLPEIVRVF